MLPGQRAEAGVQAVHRLATQQDAIDHVARGADAAQRFGIEPDVSAAAGHGEHAVDGQAVAAQHDALIGRDDGYV